MKYQFRYRWQEDMENIEIKNNKKLDGCLHGMYLEYKKILDNYNKNENILIDEKQALIYKNGREWILTSRYDADYAGDIWAEQLDDVNSTALIIIAGLGNGIYIKKALKRLHKDAKVIIYEPDIDIFVEAMKHVDLTDIIERCILIVKGINDKILPTLMSGGMSYSLIEYTRFYILPNYWNIYEADIMNVKETITDAIARQQMDKNTYITYGQEVFNNMLSNLWMVLSNSSVNELYNAIAVNEEYKNVPAVIVAAGPSLNKNIEKLKKYREKVFVIACDAALNPLLDNDIIPDIAVSVDSHKPLSNFSNDKVKYIPFVLGSKCIEWFQNEHNGKKFFFGDSYLLDKLLENFNKEFGMLDTGGSVANDAFSLADLLGFKNIILIGQDLAYSNGIYYAKGVVKKQIQKNTDGMVEVDGYYGDKVWTKLNLDSYRRWFEQQIEFKDYLNVINSTEGGAMIHGAVNMTLDEACDKYCDKEIDFTTAINNAKPTFTEAELKEVKDKVLHFDDVIKNLKKSIDSNLRDFYKLQELISRNKITNEITRIYNRINARMEEMDKEFLLEFAAMNNKSEEYEIINGVYEDTGSDIDDLKSAIEKGIQLQKSYSKNLDKLRERLPELYKKIQDN